MKVTAGALLAFRMLQTRPRRTVVLLLGYGLGIAVMIALLAVGDALLLQARDRDVVAGGDLVIVPAGIDPDVLKTGAATAMFLVMPNVRFLTRQIVMGPRFSDTVAAASPEMIDKLVYIRVRGRVIAARASGVIPSAAAAARSHLAIPDPQWRDDDQDRTWSEPTPQQRLASIDRFHLPPSGPEGQTWAEWWYFNVATNDGRHVYVSFIADRERRVRVAVTLRRSGEPALRSAETYPASALPFEAAGDAADAPAVIAAGPHRVELRDGVYRISLVGLRGPRGPLSAELMVRPDPGWYLPPFEQQSSGFRSGYVVPALRAEVRGTLTVGAKTAQISGTGYHDHNWGVWRSVTWEWGTASTASYALLAGLVRHPAVKGQEMLVTLFGTAGDRPGVMGLLRGSAPEPGDWKPGPRLGDIRPRVPGRLRYRAANDAGDRLEVIFSPDDVVATPQDPAVSGREVFLQMNGRYTITGTVGGRPVRIVTTGYAETFVPLRAAP